MIDGWVSEEGEGEVGRFDHCLEAFMAEGVEAVEEVRLLGGGVELFKANRTYKCILNVVVHGLNEVCFN